MRDRQFERTLRPLEAPGLMEIPAATAFERSIWQDRPLRQSLRKSRP